MYSREKKMDIFPESIKKLDATDLAGIGTLNGNPTFRISNHYAISLICYVFTTLFFDSLRAIWCAIFFIEIQ